MIECLSPLLTPIDVPTDWNFFVWASSRRLASSAAVGKPNVQAPQIGLQARILHRNGVRRGTGLVEVRMPQSWWRDERAARLPIDAGRIDNVAPFVQPGAQQRVAAGLGVEDLIERDPLVAVGSLLLIRWQQAEHRPQHVGDGQRPLLLSVGQQDADPALVVCARARCDLVKPAHRVLAPEFRCVETWFGSPQRGRWSGRSASPSCPPTG